ncbi:YgdI/YgdR family lipoprotein [Desulfovibrio sp. JC010]|uniref:YgdI/YgdR family lipoprotein n=1 Tax=Desulfovibrio sp. JC010 TaxID=2593641 RepID=UPI0013D3FB2B|nr:YgdI/YgdR family lipoprotein [Desulfovibrio sp. JC010]NDV28736.1 YgdI/YgdR family lipoprotein [Desulfovibrio sp. JC010]
MKNIFMAALLCAGLLVFAGCGSKHHTITKTDGSTAVSIGAPEFDKDSNTYTYENVDGEDVTIKREDVQQIEENKK